jgi:hypothetical protein
MQKSWEFANGLENMPAVTTGPGFSLFFGINSL